MLSKKCNLFFYLVSPLLLYCTRTLHPNANLIFGYGSWGIDGFNILCQSASFIYPGTTSFHGIIVPWSSLWSGECWTASLLMLATARCDALFKAQCARDCASLLLGLPFFHVVRLSFDILFAIRQISDKFVNNKSKYSVWREGWNHQKGGISQRMVTTQLPSLCNASTKGCNIFASIIAPEFCLCWVGISEGTGEKWKWKMKGARIDGNTAGHALCNLVLDGLTPRDLIRVSGSLFQRLNTSCEKKVAPKLQRNPSYSMFSSCHSLVWSSPREMKALSGLKVFIKSPPIWYP